MFFHACMHACMHVSMYGCMHVWMHACTDACVFLCMNACMHASICPCMHSMYACMNVWMHACMDAGVNESVFFPTYINIMWSSSMVNREDYSKTCVESAAQLIRCFLRTSLHAVLPFEAAPFWQDNMDNP